MGKMEEERQFEIKDRRSRFTEEVYPPAEKPKAVAEDISAAIPVTFSSFVVSLATSALMHLGHGGASATEGSPQAGSDSVRLPLARQVIDLISMLEEKTKGNLTKEEEEMISETLFALRIKFVEIEKKIRH